MSADPTPLYGLDRQGLARALAPLKLPPYRVRQIFAALYRRDHLDPALWSDLPGALRSEIARRHVITRPRIADTHGAPDGTIKALVDLPGGDQVEAVAIPAPGRMTFCISSQVGCAFGCAFCMTARLGFQRHLSAGEIVGQVAALREATGTTGETFNIVFMGMGEPLHNLPNVLGALTILGDELGFDLAPRRITVSTVGLPDGIRALARLPRPPRLAVSLVTADEQRRRELMPVARKHSLAAIAEAVRDYGRHRRDRPTLEAVLLDGINDRPEDARAMVALARSARAKVNLIEFNPTPELPFRPTPEQRLEAFLRILSEGGVVGTVRRSRGREVDGACGQLAFRSRR
ncbi:MAG TPA: 23S rRNA (adenine(2503)-C(2))-methyltransferase RlmN [Acidobacteria bacterium]|nr:23S rRNA (adenine(2503)-C(2))-methyltransferase RlmN [Acidobacteriota bacterium]